ncbi:hypothetical protein [Shewanella sp. NIFS-20-20]|uniref:hypothetical protein n=1 Tax=Shewanella sp. NIFS-20-20 TaxID=2853806 RepID=UPI001C468FE1|nr:hypothetical protein [Shewanella sp. NIFS-20-20]MBV7315438.1 hypothetical protein [Shewanella sp. NIFS-20-20]
MHPLQNGSQAEQRPASKPLTGLAGWFTESGENNVPSYPGADWFNHVIAEFQNALAETGVEFDPENDDHLAQAFINGNLSSSDSASLSRLKQKYGIAAWAQAANYRHFLIDIDDAKSGVYVIPAGQVVKFQNATITQSDDGVCFLGDSIGWRLCGKGIITRGTNKPTSEVAGSIGLSVGPNALKHTIDGGIIIERFKSVGVKFNGGGLLSGTVGRSYTNGLTCRENWDGFQFLDGFPAEYHSLTNCFSTDNANRGVLEETGNTNWIGGTISGNGGGLHLRHPTAGGNPHHGMFVGTNINHNNSYQLWAEKVAFGYDLVGCHLYDNGNAATGRIRLDNCRGINIIGGTIGAAIEYTNDGHVHVGYNSISNNKVELNKPIITGLPNFDRTKLIVKDNFDINGSWDFNDLAYALGLSMQTLSDDNVTTDPYGLYVFDTEQVDIRGTMGVSFVTPNYGLYEWNINLKLSTTEQGVGQFVEILRDDAGSGTWAVLGIIPVVYLSAASASASGSFIYPASKGAQLGFRLRSPAGYFGTKVKIGSTVSYRNI